jgi:hypothetical protein
MSQWTHVAGMIRVDAMRSVIPARVTDVEDVIGYSYYYDWDSDDLHKVENASTGPSVPIGSEGPIQYSVNVNPHLPSLAAYDVAVWGDLRDFGEESVGQIGDWLARIVTDVKASQRLLSLRDLVVKVSVEYGPTFLYTLDDEGFLMRTRDDGKSWSIGS